MQLTPMDIWLDKYENAPFNLGESGVHNNLVSDFLSGDGVDEFLKLDLNYNSTRGSVELRRTVAALYNSIDEENVLIATGATEPIFLYYQSTFKAGANVVVVVPTFHSLYDVPDVIGYEVRKVSLRIEDQFALPLDDIKRKVDSRTSAIVVCSPNNPTGMVCTDSDWDALIELADRFDCDIVVDEEYRFLPYETDRSLVPSAVGRSPRVISLSSPGKCFGCVGLRIGWMVGRQEIIDQCLAFKTLTTHAVFKGSDLLACKVIENRTTLTNKYRSWILSNLLTLEELVRKHSSEIEYVRPRAGSIAFLRIKNWPSAQAFAEELVSKTGVFVLPGDAFDMPDFFRIRLGVPPAHFEEAISRMSQVLEEGDVSLKAKLGTFE